MSEANQQTRTTVLKNLKYDDAVRVAEKLIAEGATVEVLPNDLKTLWPRYTVTAESPVVSSPN